MGDFHSPPSTLIKARPLAPIEMAASVSRVISPWVTSARPLPFMALTTPHRGDGRLENLKSGVPEGVGEIFELEAEPGIGFIHAKPVHGVREGHAGKGVSISTFRMSFQIFLQRPSSRAYMPSRSTKETSMSSWVNSS